MAINSVLAKLAVNISANTAQFNQSLAKTQKDLSSFTSGIKNMAGVIGVAFSTQQVASFALEVSRLSGEAEAVGAAFARLPNSIHLMSELKRATGGTVSELDLMKRAVQASNFEISLEALPRLLEFATLRAQQTGQSVDYLVDSIVTGIGRKSKLILDNLGISAVQLTEALGGASAMSSSIEDVANAVGRIAEKNLKNMEDFAENASTKLQRLTASWEDLKVAMGDAANSSGVLGKTTNMLTNFFNSISGDEFTSGFNQLLASGGRASEILERFASAGGRIDLTWQQLLERGFVRTEEAARKYEKVLADIAEKQKNISHITVDIDPTTGLPTSGRTKWDPSMAQKHIESLSSLKEKEKALLDVFEETNAADKQKLQNTSAQILAIREQIKAIEDLLKVEAKIPLSLTAQRALGDSGHLQNVKVFGRVVEKPTPEGGISRREISPLSGPLAVDLEKMEAYAQKMVEMSNATRNATTEMKQHWIDLGGVVTGSITSLAESLGGAIVGMEDFGSAIIKTFAGFAKEFGSMLIASGIAALALEQLITNPVTAIAAGVALVALAGAASAGLSRAHTGMMGGGGGAPGRTPSEANLKIGGRIRGYDLALVEQKDSYRRSRVG